VNVNVRRQITVRFTMLPRDCPKCGLTFNAINAYGQCPDCRYAFEALPTQIILSGHLGKTSERDLLAAIAAYHQVPFLESLDYPVDRELATELGEAFCRCHSTMPLKIDGTVRFIVNDPEIQGLADELLDKTNQLPEFAVSDISCIRKKQNEHFGCSTRRSSIDIFPMEIPDRT